MELDPETCYRAVLSHDRRFDGRFFVAVSSTGIYCRPVCAVRTPKRENCSFFATAAAAEKHGYRPCLRCRPELAPGHGLADISGRLAQAAATLIDEGFLAEASVAALAGRIGVTERHLRRLFVEQFGVSPLEYAQTQRLLLAKRLLADTALPITEVALAAGFGSVRRFNDVLKTRYGLAPSAMRKHAATLAPQAALHFELGYRPPFAWQAWLDFVGARAVAGIEALTEAGEYARTVCIDSGGRSHRGWIRIGHGPQRHVVRVAVSASLARVIPQVLGKVRRLCDLGCRPDMVDAHLGELAADMPGMRLPGTVDGLEIAVRAVLGQVVSLAQARAALARLVQAYGAPLDTPEGAMTRCFPDAATLAATSPAQLAGLGITTAKATAIHRIASEIAAGRLSLDPAAEPAQTVAALCRIDGVGDWTAQYVAMRALGWPDAFPASDYALRKVLGIASNGPMLRHAARWAPWRAYAAMHLWHRYQQGERAAAPAAPAQPELAS